MRCTKEGGDTPRSTSVHECECAYKRSYTILSLVAKKRVSSMQILEQNKVACKAWPVGMSGCCIISLLHCFWQSFAVQFQNYKKIKIKKNSASLHMGPQTRRRPKIKQHPEFMFVTPFLPRHLHYCQPLGDRNTVECCTRKDPSALRV